jgi:tRNA pseudouridine13 synthase
VTWRPAEPEDFVVDELPLYAPTGEGGHTFVRVEKRDATTEEVGRALARAAGVAPRDVGYAGRKDRVAIARQWLSVPGLDPDAALALDLPRARVLEAVRHPHKLRTGQLRGNAFEIRLRDLEASTRERVERRLAHFAERGFPNRFGMQRFGRDGDNAARGAALLAGRERVRDRRAARFLVSALQAAVFNEALARRAAPLDTVELGDVARVEASGGLFLVEELAREAPRAAAFEISATGPIFGTREIAPHGEPALRERAALAAFGIDPEAPLRPPPGLAQRGARRALRARAEAARLEPAEGGVRLCCTLGPGTYATVLIEELLREDDSGGTLGLSSPDRHHEEPSS